MLTTKDDKSSSYGRSIAEDEQVVTEYNEESNLFFGFTGKEEIRSSTSQPDHLLGLGLIQYEYACFRDEKIRLFGAFCWGIPESPCKATDGGSVVSTAFVNQGTVTTKTLEATKDWEYTDASDFEKLVALATIGLNILFFLCFICYIIAKCCCGRKTVYRNNTKTVII